MAADNGSLETGRTEELGQFCWPEAGGYADGAVVEGNGTPAEQGGG